MDPAVADVYVGNRQVAGFGPGHRAAPCLHPARVVSAPRAPRFESQEVDGKARLGNTLGFKARLALDERDLRLARGAALVLD